MQKSMHNRGESEEAADISSHNRLLRPPTCSEGVSRRPTVGGSVLELVGHNLLLPHLLRGGLGVASSSELLLDLNLILRRIDVLLLLGGNEHGIYGVSNSHVRLRWSGGLRRALLTRAGVWREF